MNRAERRRQERAKKKRTYANGPETQLEVEMIQPWSDVLMRVKLPQMIVDAMLDITDQVLQDPDRKNWGENLAGQIADEPLIPHKLMENYKIGKEGNVYAFFMDIVGKYVYHCMIQSATSNMIDQIKNIEWLTQMKSCWIISQWESEYNPIHIHTECQLSTVMYLKIPEFLPSTKPERDDDGCIMFIGGAKNPSHLTRNLLKWKPKVGDFFVFPAHLQHTVYPFRTDGDFERRSVSFNADFIDKAVLEKRQKEQEEMMKQQQQQTPQPIQQAPETLTINTEA
tara:strand:- start:2451 stop:3296 length:846 start_codon:yes stop_codon:yes gene_type:complete